jgi:malonyl-CoA/methylmalonyl-CoA synthetase
VRDFVAVEGFAARARSYGTRRAIIDPAGSWTYLQLASDAAGLAGVLLGDADDLDDERVAVLCTPGRDYVTALLACWGAGAVAVPIHPAHPEPEQNYVAGNSEVSCVIASHEYDDVARRLALTVGARHLSVAASGEPTATLAFDVDRPSLILYTSGTTGPPKGVVHTHHSLLAQVIGLIDAWAWSPDDRILLVLPLHHVHGIVNVTLCALYSGATCEAPGGFDAVATWERLASGELTVFMAVPTIYARLISAWTEASDADQARWSEGAAQLRLMVSGSAALPVSTLERWQDISGQVLLERYGMTEIGMALSNTLASRVPGKVGFPLPGVEVRIVDDTGNDVDEGEAGELLVRGPNVFAAYWRNPEATTAAFDDGWFLTGDVAVHEPDGYRLLGRASVDIIKTGGEKVSALEVEEVFRTHPAIDDLAVVGVADDEWGERVCAAIVTKAGAALDVDSLRAWGKARLAPAKVPTLYLFVDALPRNAMGKVTKPDVACLFAPR